MLIRVTGWVPYVGSWSTDWDTQSGHSAHVAAQIILNRIISKFMARDENINRPRRIRQVWAEEIKDESFGQKMVGPGRYSPEVGTGSEGRAEKGDGHSRAEETPSLASGV